MSLHQFLLMQPSSSLKEQEAWQQQPSRCQSHGGVACYRAKERSISCPSDKGLVALEEVVRGAERSFFQYSAHTS